MQNLGFLWVFFKYPKISNNGNPLFFPVQRSNYQWFSAPLDLFSLFSSFKTCVLVVGRNSNLISMSFKMGSFYKLHRDLWNPPGDNNRTFVVSLDYQIHNQECMHMLTKTSAPLRLASHAGVFRGARLSSLREG